MIVAVFRIRKKRKPEETITGSGNHSPYLYGIQLHGKTPPDGARRERCTG